MLRLFRDWRKGREWQTAVQAAYRRFVAERPWWADSLFDDYFLGCKAAVLFAEETLPSPLALAQAWRSQFNVGSPGQKRADIHNLVPEMQAFLALVEQERSLSR